MADKRIRWYDRQQVDVQDMTREQNYNISKRNDSFDNIFNAGVVNGLIISDDSDSISQIVENSDDATLANTSSLSASSLPSCVSAPITILPSASKV